MEQLIAERHGTITASTGYGWTTLGLSQTIVYHIFVEATTSSTVFDVVIENVHGDELIRFEGAVGVLNEEVRVPFSRSGTLKIYNSTVDEDLTYNIALKEN